MARHTSNRNTVDKNGYLPILHSYDLSSHLPFHAKYAMAGNASMITPPKITRSTVALKSTPKTKPKIEAESATPTTIETQNHLIFVSLKISLSYSEACPPESALPT